MYHAGLILELIGFVFVAVVVGIIIVYRRGKTKDWLDNRKRFIQAIADKKPDNKLWQWLAGPDAVTLIILVLGTICGFTGLILELKVTW